MKEIILSYFQAKILSDARRSGLETVLVSLDLGLSTNLVCLNASGVQLLHNVCISWDDIHSVLVSHSSCYVYDSTGLHAIHFYSELTDRVYSLYPTAGAPSMLVSGIPMHRTKGTDPYQDTLEKIHSITPVVGKVLDTATGLGYTAIQAARTAGHVTTIELDPKVLNVCQLNPWSQELFNNPKITQMIGDSYELVAGMESNQFTRVIHDPPAFSLAGDLYSAEFYRQLNRVMRNQGKLFHYVGDPESKSGHSITAGVVRRLEQVGFRQVRRAPKAFGVVALK